MTLLKDARIIRTRAYGCDIKLSSGRVLIGVPRFFLGLEAVWQTDDGVAVHSPWDLAIRPLLGGAR